MGMRQQNFWLPNKKVKKVEEEERKYLLYIFVDSNCLGW